MTLLRRKHMLFGPHLTIFEPVDRPIKEWAFLSVRTLAMPANPITYSWKSMVPLFRVTRNRNQESAMNTTSRVADTSYSVEGHWG